MAIVAGIYTVTVTDNNNCVTSLTVNLIDPSVLSATESHININCYGAATGSIDVSINNAIGPVNYLWNDGDTNEDRTGLIAGTYSVAITDSCGQIQILSIDITENPEIVVTAISTDLQCYNDNNGEIDLSVAGGLSPYSYSWSNGSSTEDLGGLPAGTFTVTI